MKNLNTILEECSINDIYFSNRGSSVVYKIPIYQRNYAWEYDHIKALINDVYDSYRKSDSDPYYIGTLVTFHRRESVYEVIDGQQRLTTLFLALRAMGVTKTVSRLTYEATSEAAEAYARRAEKADPEERRGSSRRRRRRSRLAETTQQNQPE